MYAETLKAEVNAVLNSYGVVDLTDRLQLLMNLIFVYHVIKASYDLTLQSSILESDSAVAAYLREHAEEEKDHDKWLAEDLLTAGIDVHKTVIPVSAVEMCGTVYYLINHVEPAAILGHMLVLERPAAMTFIETLESLHGKELLRTARYHAEHDIMHGCELDGVIEALPDDRKWIVSQTAIKSAHYFGRGIYGVRDGVNRLHGSDGRSDSKTH